jgi:hypothetical protein
LCAVIQDRGGTRIGSTHKGPLELQHAHTRYLQVLVYREGIPKPRYVAHIDKNGGGGGVVGKPGAKLFTEEIFVANVYG